MRTKRYYTIRTMVRYAIWFPLGAYVYLQLVIGWANAL
jgi:hypothetical protein